jgi:hypothetical protein
MDNGVKQMTTPYTRLPRTSPYQSQTTAELERLVSIWEPQSIADPSMGRWDNSLTFRHKIASVKAEIAFRAANPGSYEAEQALEAIGKTKFGW